MGSEDANPAEQKMQLDALAYWMRLAAQHPESSVKTVEMHDLMDHVPLDKVWYRNKVPGFRVMDKSELPADAKLGVAYQSIIVTPHTFLPWIRKRLEASGVVFKRATVRSVADLKGMGHDVLINASGSGPKTLTDIKDDSMVLVRGQTCLVKSSYDKIYIRRGDDYTYHLPRGDGTAILGGIKDEGQSEAIFEESVKKDVSTAISFQPASLLFVESNLSMQIVRRVHENLPHVFPSPDPKDFQVVRDLVGIRPSREGGVRVESQIMDGQHVIHAYGVAGAGYVYGWGLAKAAVELLNQHLYQMPASAKL